MVLIVCTFLEDCGLIKNGKISNLNDVYNNLKYPVDIFKLRCANYDISFRSRRCTFALLKNILVVAMTNTFVITRIFNKSLDHAKFLRTLGKALCEKWITESFPVMNKKE
ncbi:hypothetical protein EIN_350780 [Entamoeba invadens IP1]|uniref:PiggyBac transposable element-derived protein domain-containing protein n=1 Tax=Entamoeba invadens IP1 TaxID=370355 RepID=L7FNF2_ENTIV|nr:hypothetical protein EIN_350780 [Entamoeba invadens IP1]ELP91973.1 hypothetical protein EIN_350780 [Entamoeba invadens IP1]|eukprot:XP_004258744.1 hypothetical protein EIN_350780 [Entamoeba invadens IP1]